MSENPPPPPYSAPPPQDPYQQGGYDQPPQKVGSGLAITALVLGILGLITSFVLIGGVLGLIALILGFIASGRAKRGQARGRGMAITGIVLGVLSVIIAIVIVVVGASFLNSDSGKNLRDCVSKAGDDQAQVQKCQDDFKNDLQN